MMHTASSTLQVRSVVASAGVQQPSCTSTTLGYWWSAVSAHAPVLGPDCVNDALLTLVIACRLCVLGLETKLERLMAAKGSSFEKEVAYRASQAAGALAWQLML